MTEVSLDVIARRMEQHLRELPSAAAVIPPKFGKSLSWSGQVVKIKLTTNGLIAGRMDLQGWASDGRLNGDPTTERVITCFVSMINGALGQRGQLMNEISRDAVALRLTGFVLDFSLWLPRMSLKTHKEDADHFYATMVARALSRLSHAEAKEYFPLFSLKKAVDEAVMEAPMASLPLSAPAPVPRHDKEQAQKLAPKEVCEMMLCSTKQKKRKGMPYCGTCRKFMEETVKWYFDQFHRHPAKEKDRFVLAVRMQRYFCKLQGQGNRDEESRKTCSCKACHSLRRFQEMYPKCEPNLHKFKSRSYFFDNNDEKPMVPVADAPEKKPKMKMAQHKPVAHASTNYLPGPESLPEEPHEMESGLKRGRHAEFEGSGKRSRGMAAHYMSSSPPANIPEPHRHKYGYHHKMRGEHPFSHDAGGGYFFGHQSDPLDLFDPTLLQRMTERASSTTSQGSYGHLADPWACPACGSWNHVGNTWCSRCNYLHDSS
eukprot:m.35131 g.35131  ORF g.35131 m.35131 type:complete len:486 (-) comp8839_c0_seq2:955-2412(-)